ncbi:MAG: hypothetical protein JSW42_03850, partial [Chloroflexota bacterium]
MNRTIGLLLTIFVFGILAFSASPASAQQGGKVQELTGMIEPGEIIIYDLPSLRKGQHLHFHASTISGNLDPIIFITDTAFDPNMLEADVESAMDRAAQEDLDPLEVLDEVRDQHALAWDDDSGGGLSAALTFIVPEDGDYRLVIGGVLSISGIHTFGEYRILAGLNSPEILEGEAETTGDTIAILDVSATPPGIGIQEITGSLSPEKPSTFVELYGFKED